MWSRRCCPELDGFETTKGGVRFTKDHQIPLAVCDRTLRERKAEIAAALDKKGS